MGRGPRHVLEHVRLSEAAVKAAAEWHQAGVTYRDIGRLLVRYRLVDRPVPAGTLRRRLLAAGLVEPKAVETYNGRATSSQ